MLTRTEARIEIPTLGRSKWSGKHPPMFSTGGNKPDIATSSWEGPNNIWAARHGQVLDISCDPLLRDIGDLAGGSA
ncbi:hypothetical protein FIBSPDRAFT_87737 [Athelia psychrophila]|uniref:Uncharacterized protein n=1 Tax=Athelia psychrophila TaxID=1759441 RepID=A0A166DYC0_9AGAM|nr:hypothetical protein FIBSPDRAFT_87737 [Fibularhizoctonia sp. CBS 109695]